MLTEVKNSLKLLIYYFKFNLSALMEYRVSFLIQCFGMILNNASFIFFWWILFNNVKSIGGYGFKEVMMLWAISSTSFGICFLTFGNVSRITRMILNGELDTYLLQPKDVLISVLCSKSEVSAWGDTLYGIILFFAIRGLDLRGFLLFIIFTITGALFFASVLVAFNALSFYTGSAEGIVSLITEFLISFSLYPEQIFKGGIRYVLYSLIPAGFIVYLPARVIAKFSLAGFLEVLGAALLWIIIAYAAFYRGLKRYESGNLIINKL